MSSCNFGPSVAAVEQLTRARRLTPALAAEPPAVLCEISTWDRKRRRLLHLCTAKFGRLRPGGIERSTQNVRR